MRAIVHSATRGAGGAQATRKRNPDASRLRILEAATRHFGEVGFDGARVDAIARAARINKQLLYHYFGNKDALFTQVLERAYQQLREQESALDLDRLPADRAILALVDFTWQYYLDPPDFIRLLNSENQMQARHLLASRRAAAINARHLRIFRNLIARGQKEKTVRGDIDAQLQRIEIAAHGFFFLTAGDEGAKDAQVAGVEARGAARGLKMARLHLVFAVEEADEVGVGQVVLPGEVDQGEDGLVGGQSVEVEGRFLFAELQVGAFEDLGEEGVLIPEVVIEQLFVDAGGAGDGVDAGAVEADCAEVPCCGVEDAQAACGGVASAGR